MTLIKRENFWTFKSNRHHFMFMLGGVIHEPVNNLATNECVLISLFSQVIADMAKQAYPNDLQFWQMDIVGDVEKLKKLMTDTVRGFPFESTQEIGMNQNFRSELTSFFLRYPTPLIKLASKPERVIVDVTNSNILTVISQL